MTPAEWEVATDDALERGDLAIPTPHAPVLVALRGTADSGPWLSVFRAHEPQWMRWYYYHSPDCGRTRDGWRPWQFTGGAAWVD